MGDRNSTRYCPDDALKEFLNSVEAQILQVDALLLVNVILMLVMVGIDAYGHRYRHHRLTRFLFLGATTLFLPIISYVVSTIRNLEYAAPAFYPNDGIIVKCDLSDDRILVLVFTGLVLIIGINATPVVAADTREGQNIWPPTVLLVQAIWASYLAVKTNTELIYTHKQSCFFLLLPFALVFAKLVFKFYAWCKARQSLGHGRNPRLIVGYMKRLQDTGHHHMPPPLIVAGEGAVSIEEQPHGYRIVNGATDRTNNGLVTLDKVWQLDLRSRELKDLCFAFALFKMLRCRFASYTSAEAGFIKARSFLRGLLLEHSDDQRVFELIAHELSFLHDCYHSSLPMSYSNKWFPILSIFISLLSISYCLFATTFLMHLFLKHKEKGWQIRCLLDCSSSYTNTADENTFASIGSLPLVLVPVCLVVALVVLAEMWEIASYIFSNWTKVVLVCRYSNHASCQQSPIMQKCITHVLPFECKLLKHWQDKMNQCSVLVLHPKKTPVALLRHLIRLPDQNNKVPRAVKAAVFDALRSYEQSLQNNAVICMRRSLHLQVGNEIVWTFSDTKGIAHTMLVCHVATSILEVKPHLHHQPLCDHKIAATHLSRYGAYLVANCPELLPDDDMWCKSLFTEVKDDAARVLSGMSTPKLEFQRLVELMSATENHEVLKDGAKLGEQLAELNQGETEAVWEVLAGFWSETILYVAPSDNIDGHAEAIARGGELITLLWALLAHLGVRRTVATDDDCVGA